MNGHAHRAIDSVYVSKRKPRRKINHDAHLESRKGCLPIESDWREGGGSGTRRRHVHQSTSTKKKLLIRETHEECLSSSSSDDSSNSTIDIPMLIPVNDKRNKEPVIRRGDNRNRTQVNVASKVRMFEENRKIQYRRDTNQHSLSSKILSDATLKTANRQNRSNIFSNSYSGHDSEENGNQYDEDDSSHVVTNQWTSFPNQLCDEYRCSFDQCSEDVHCSKMPPEDSLTVITPSVPVVPPPAAHRSRSESSGSDGSSSENSSSIAPRKCEAKEQSSSKVTIQRNLPDNRTLDEDSTKTQNPAPTDTKQEKPSRSSPVLKGVIAFTLVGLLSVSVSVPIALNETRSTPFPTTSPAPSVSFRPTFSPFPSLAPSSSTEPSQKPSVRPTMSLEPSSEPSISQNPSSTPSESPTISSSPSLLPSSIPSLSPTISMAPSDVPSVTPSTSLIPSAGPTLSASPSYPTSASRANVSFWLLLIQILVCLVVGNT